MRVTIVVALFAVACDSGPDHEITKDMHMSNTAHGKTEPQTCVEGVEATCTHAGGRWHADKCCLPKSSCAPGDDSACVRVKGTWTGRYCCLAGDYRLMSDDEASCAKLGGAWTGRRCLVK